MEVDIHQAWLGLRQGRLARGRKRRKRPANCSPRATGTDVTWTIASTSKCIA